MIRLLTESEREAATALLSQNSALNLYFLGNLKSFGFDGHFCQFWGDFDGAGELRAVLNRYRVGWVVYGKKGSDWAGLGQIVDNHPVRAERLQDNPGGIDSFLPYLEGYKASEIAVLTLMTLDRSDFRPVAGERTEIVVRQATPADLEKLTLFYSHAENMSRTPASVADALEIRRIWIAEGRQDGSVRSAALTNAESREQAMIGGVYTPPTYRGRGYSQAVMSHLCSSVLADGLCPVLYWENPVAGAVYHKLGFKPIGSWRAVRLMETGNSHPERSADQG